MENIYLADKSINFPTTISSTAPQTSIQNVPNIEGKYCFFFLELIGNVASNLFSTDVSNNIKTKQTKDRNFIHCGSQLWMWKKTD